MIVGVDNGIVVIEAKNASGANIFKVKNRRVGFSLKKFKIQKNERRRLTVRLPGTSNPAQLG